MEKFKVGRPQKKQRLTLVLLGGLQACHFSHGCMQCTHPSCLTRQSSPALCSLLMPQYLPCPTVLKSRCHRQGLSPTSSTVCFHGSHLGRKLETDVKTSDLEGHPPLSNTILTPDPAGQGHFQVPLLTGKKYISRGVKAKFLSSFTIQFYLLTKQV